MGTEYPGGPAPAIRFLRGNSGGAGLSYVWAMLSLQEVALRLVVATLVGAVVGLNRDLHHKPAGLRTHSLVGLSSALLVIVALDLTPRDMAGVTRVIQGIVTGIGFLGAGVILHQGESAEIRGLTTAATIWLTAAIGVGCGVGAWRAAGITVILLLAVLILGGGVERAMHRWLRGRSPEAHEHEE
jgi:putative Mg2+ transporter-C (MgtC) family protein